VVCQNIVTVRMLTW